MKPGIEKNIRPSGKHGIFIQKYLAKILDYYIKNVRKKLCPETDVLSLWISHSGYPLQADSFLARIKKILQMFSDANNFNPPKQINPQDFRRLVPSIVYSQDIHPDNVSMMDFIDTYSALVATSPRITMIHYIRSKNAAKQINAIETLEQRILLSVDGKKKK